MQTCKLGNNGLTVSVIGLGCMGLNYHRGPAPERKEMNGARPGGGRARCHLLRHR